MPYMYTEEDPTVLCHYGRLGMKWYQHIFGDDPRWGRFGRAKRKKGELKTTEEEEKKEAKPLTKSDYKKKANKVYSLSDKELSELTQRLKAQKEFKDLVDSQTRPAKSMSKAALKKVAQSALEGLGYGAASITAKKLAEYIERKANGTSDVSDILRMAQDYLKGKTIPKKK